VKLSPDVLRLDAKKAADSIAEKFRAIVVDTLKRRGVVVALSGGIDSSVTAGLAVRAVGREHVLGLLLPERDSARETLGLSQAVGRALGIETVAQDITPILQAAGCYEGRDASIRKVVPDYGPGWKAKIVLPNVLESETVRFYSVVVQSPEGETRRVRMTPEAYLGVVAATNFKQRTRKMLEYYHADRLNYCVAATPNRLEYDQGFFVKGGDGLGDVKPIAHLYKQQVYALAEEVGVPAEVRDRRPTTDTYTLPQSQDEFYFSLPYEQMDLCLWAKNHSVPAPDVAAALRLGVEQVERVFKDIEQKRRTTRYLHLKAQLLEAVPEVGA